LKFLEVVAAKSGDICGALCKQTKIFCKFKLCAAGGIYALKIEDLTKFQAMGTSIFSNALKSEEFNDRLTNIYQGILNPTQRKYEEAFVKYISNYNNKSFDTGVGTYFLKPTVIQINGITKTIKQWNKLSLNSQGHIVEIPCN
jgi:hypothetical protein